MQTQEQQDTFNNKSYFAKEKMPAGVHMERYRQAICFGWSSTWNRLELKKFLSPCKSYSCAHLLLE